MHDDDTGARSDPLNIARATEKRKMDVEVGDVKVVRDEEGRIVNVLREGKGEGVRWGEPLNDNEEDGSGEGDEEGERYAGGIIPQLEEASRLEKKPRPRKQSQREGEWIAQLVEKWGDDVVGMARDRRLNPMQQSQGDLRRRVREWRKSRRAETVGM